MSYVRPHSFFHSTVCNRVTNSVPVKYKIKYTVLELQQNFDTLFLTVIMPWKEAVLLVLYFFVL